MNIADLIAAITKGMDPSQAMVQQASTGGVPQNPPPVITADTPPPAPTSVFDTGAGAIPPVSPGVTPPPQAGLTTPTPDPASGGGARTPPVPPVPIPTTAAPEGVKTPTTIPAPAKDVPKAMQSPPDLANMYAKIMQQSQNAAALDRGMTLIAAGLTNNPQTRQALISRSGSGGGGGGAGMSAQDFINLHKQQAEMQNALLRKSMLGGLMKQYKMTPEQIQYLEAAGKLDEVIKHYSTENLGVAKDENGQSILFNPRTGAEITRLGSEKGPKTKEITRPDGSKYLVNEETGEPIKELAPAVKPGDAVPTSVDELVHINKAREARGEKPLTAEELIKLKQTPPTQINIGKDGVPYPNPEPGYAYERNPDGTVKIGEDGRPRQYTIAGSKAAGAEVAKTKEQEDAAKAERMSKAQKSFTAGNVGQATDKAFANVDGIGVTGFGSGWLRKINPGGTGMSDFDSAVKTIEANAAFAQLKQMRAEAASGASGLGQVTEKENKMLSSVISSLEHAQSTAEVKKGLARIKAAMIVMAAEDIPEHELPARINSMADQILVDEANKKAKGSGGSVIRRRD